MIITTIIKTKIAIVDVEILRRGCRFMARQNKNKGDLGRVKKWNDLAYQGDVLLGHLRNG